MRTASWSWLETHIYGLLDKPLIYDGFGGAHPANRLQAALMPEPTPKPKAVTA